MMTQPIQALVLDTEHRILRRPDVERKTGFKRAHIYALIAQGRFLSPSSSACVPSAGTRWRSSAG